MSRKDFDNYFKKKQFDKAAAEFVNLSKAEQITLLEGLYQSMMSGTAPDFVSVLFRKLRPGCTYQDFHQAWLPPEKNCKKDSDGYFNYFHYPTTVLFAENINDKTDIVIVGLTWATPDQVNQELQRIKNSEQERHDNIDKVAEKISGNIYHLKYNHKLGTKF